MRPLDQRTVCYGFVGKESSGRWEFSPEAPFRPLSFLLWAEPGATLLSLRLCHEEQLAAPCPVQLFQPDYSPARLLEQGLPAPRTLAPSEVQLVTLFGTPFRQLVLPPRRLTRAVGIGQRLELEWHGTLLGAAFVGPQLVL